MGELSYALRDATKAPREIRCDLGETPRDQAILMARSFGLTPEISAAEAEAAGTSQAAIGGSSDGDYRLDAHSGRTFVTLKPGALEKVVHAFDPADTQAYQAAQAIKQGSQDEEGWLPTGIERRPASTFNDPGYSLSRFDTRLALTPSMRPAQVREAVKDYIGAQVGEGHPWASLRSDMQAEAFRSPAGGAVPAEHQQQYDALCAEFFPGTARGELTPKEYQDKRAEIDAAAEAQAQQFSADYKQRRGMTDQDLVSLNTQRLSVGEAQPQFDEAAHRTLAQMPAAKVAFTKMGDLDHADKATLREYFQQEVVRTKPLSAEEQRLTARQQARDAAKAAEPASAPPEQHGFDMGDLDETAGIKIHDAATQEKLAAAGTTAEAVQAENKERVKQQQAADSGGSESPTAPDTRTPEQQAWDHYVQAHGGQQQAYETLQSVIRGKAVEAFAGHYGKVFGRPLKLGKAPLPHWENHVLGQLSPEKVKAAMGDRAAEAQKHMATLATRSGGKFAKEANEGDRRQAYEKLQQTMAGQQGKLYGGDQFPTPDRPTLGHDAEAQLASVWGNAAQQFSGKQGAVQLVPDLSMSGDKVKQQRAIKLALANRRLGLHMGAGSGKTLTAVGAFTEMHAKGMARKGVFVVPSAVQGQFGAELSRYTTPGKYQWLADPKATREERMAAYADDSTHMIRMQSLAHTEATGMASISSSVMVG